MDYLDYLKGTFHKLTKNVFQDAKENDNTVEVSKMDAYLNYVHKILVWEDPTISWATLGVLNFSFWLIVYLEIRIYGVIILTTLTLFVMDLYFEQCGLKAPRTPSSDAVRKVIKFCLDFITYLKLMRKENPSMFCGIMCIVFLTLSFIARNINGYLLSYMVLIMIFFGPLMFSKLPPECSNQFKRCIKMIGTNEGMLAEKELIPFLTEKDEDAESLVSEKTADSVTNSLISGISAMPSYLDAEGSIDGLDEEDLELPLQVAKGEVEYSSDSDSDHKNMRFDSSHFNRDSSSDEEHAYSKGLSFSDTVDFGNNKSAVPLNLAQSIGAGLISNLSTVGSNILTNVLSTVSKPQIRRDSDSDFEIINSDDLSEEAD